MEISRPNQRRITIVCALVLIVLVAGVFVKQHYVAALKGTDKNPPTTSTAKQVEPKPESSDVPQPIPAVQQQPAKPETPALPQEYTYTAQPGDSFTQFAHDAIRQYAADRNLQTTEAQLAAAETTLINIAGAPLLDIGQQVRISGTDVALALGV